MKFKIGDFVTLKRLSTEYVEVYFGIDSSLFSRLAQENIVFKIDLVGTDDNGYIISLVSQVSDPDFYSKIQTLLQCNYFCASELKHYISEKIKDKKDLKNTVNIISI